MKKDTKQRRAAHVRRLYQLLAANDMAAVVRMCNSGVGTWTVVDWVRRLTATRAGSVMCWRRRSLLQAVDAWSYGATDVMTHLIYR